MSTTAFNALSSAETTRWGRKQTFNNASTPSSICGKRASALIIDDPIRDFDQMEEFRDFVVWLCGFVDRTAPSSQEEWERLRMVTKKIAVKFVARRRELNNNSWEAEKQRELF